MGHPGMPEVKVKAKEADCVDARDDDILKKKIQELDEKRVFLENDWFLTLRCQSPIIVIYEDNF